MLIVQLMWDCTCTIASVPARIGLGELLAEADSVCEVEIENISFFTEK